MKCAVILLFFTSLCMAAPKEAVLTIETAQKLSNKLLECGKKNKWKLSVAIVNSEGNLIHFMRDDGANVGSIEASVNKARSANAFQRPTKAFSDAVKEGRNDMLSMPAIIASEGGYPLMLNEKQVGAIGVSGAKATEDDQCAKEVASSL